MNTIILTIWNFIEYFQRKIAGTENFQNFDIQFSTTFEACTTIKKRGSTTTPCLESYRLAGNPKPKCAKTPLRHQYPHQSVTKSPKSSKPWVLICCSVFKTGIKIPSIDPVVRDIHFKSYHDSFEPRQVPSKWRYSVKVSLYLQEHRRN